jgi:riboflavin-specific deaminase-like protein
MKFIAQALRHSTTVSSRRPFVLVNMAMTADGKIATANRTISTFSSSRDQEHLLELRATADALIMGARTAESDGVTMGPGPARFRRMRLKRGLAEYNLRVIVTGSGSINIRAEVFESRFSPIILLTTERVASRRREVLERVADEVAVFGDAELDFTSALEWLRSKWGINRLLSEGGGDLNDALFRAGLIDEIHVTICPLVFGGRTAPTISEGLGVSRLSDARRYSLQSLNQVSNEVFAVYAATRTERSGGAK